MIEASFKQGDVYVFTGQSQSSRCYFVSYENGERVEISDATLHVGVNNFTLVECESLKTGLRQRVPLQWLTRYSEPAHFCQKCGVALYGD